MPIVQAGLNTWFKPACTSPGLPRMPVQTASKNNTSARHTDAYLQATARTVGGAVRPNGPGSLSQSERCVKAAGFRQLPVRVEKG